MSKPILLVSQVETMVLRACKTLRAVPDPDKRFQWIKSNWPDVVQSIEDAYGYTSEAMPRFKPTPHDIDVYLDVLAWLRPVRQREFKLVWWRSFGFSFGQMGMKLGRSDETVRRWYRDVILRAWHEANATN